MFETPNEAVCNRKSVCRYIPREVSSDFLSGELSGCGKFSGIFVRPNFPRDSFSGGGGTSLLSLTPTSVIGLCRGQLLIGPPIQRHLIFCLFILTWPAGLFDPT